ncbi:YqhA family protein [Calditerrivibrio nitroreducens]|uniref:Uncharacterized protein family UPF0114 n=1 Tax=Calditerrivibrio nitroreducens (strain DSM 19672 / NBRC 101217 / Yu37-1) TaxID=768670 RepID=E4THR9_CALNY|nr:YqhA family protein [Calditerrivibrio nitroreducens]ADR19930.1 Uncharacterized protein family UPF0114 [Calditerrivibrio nitroreducens DSM 19672]
MKKIEFFFEKLLWHSRLFLFFAVISSVFAAILLIFMGTLDIFILFKKVIYSMGDYSYYESIQKESLGKIIGAIDNYLISTVLFIFGIGLYELFISKIDLLEKDNKSSKILVIHSLDQLKDKIAKVVVMVLIVTFFKYSISQKDWDMVKLLILAAGTLLVSFSLYIINSKGGHDEEKQ